MSLGKHLSGYTVDDEGHTLMDLVTLCNLSCECGMTEKFCVSCTPYKMKIFSLLEKILKNHGIRKGCIVERTPFSVNENIMYYCDKYHRYIGILINEQSHVMNYSFHGTVIYYLVCKCMYEIQPALCVHLVTALKYNGLKELGDYAQLIMSSSIGTLFYLQIEFSPLLNKFLINKQ